MVRTLLNWRYDIIHSDRTRAKNTRYIISWFADSDHFVFPVSQTQGIVKFIADKIIILPCNCLHTPYTDINTRYNFIFKLC